MQREELAYGHMSFASRDPVFVELGPSAQMPRGGWLAALTGSLFFPFESTSHAARRNRRTAELAGSLNEIEQRHGCDPLSPVLCYTPKSCLVVEIKGARPHALDPRGARAEGADGHGDGAGNVTLHRSDSLHSTSHVAEPAEGSVRPHPLLAGELIDHSLSQQQKK